MPVFWQRLEAQLSLNLWLRTVFVGGDEKKIRDAGQRLTSIILFRILRAIFASFALGFGTCLLLFIVSIFIVGHDSAEILMGPLAIFMFALIMFPFVYKNLK
jgi:hypothetical protein